MKPLGRKAYGSIPHLPNSRLGPGDYSCHEGQYRICCEKWRDKNDRIIVTEKLDGSNVAVGKVNGRIVACTRAGYLAETSPYKQHHFFKEWVEKNEARFDSCLKEGFSIHGEWLAQAHGTIYNLTHEPFVFFDIKENGERVPYDEAISIGKDFIPARLIHDGEPILVEKIMAIIEPSGHGAEYVEGAVWRVERKGVFDFLTKFVRHDKIDGKHFSDSEDELIWNWTP